MQEDIHIKLFDSEHVLIDKIYLYSIKITGIKDFPALIERGIIETIPSKKRQITLPGVPPFTSLRIEKTDFFDLFFCSVSKKGMFFSALELSVRNPVNSSAKVAVCNLNCHTVYEVKLRVTLVQKNLLEMYGISTDMGSVLVKSIELNRTIRLEHGSFDTYLRSIALLMHLFSGKLRLTHGTEHAFLASPSRPLQAQTFERDSGKRGMKVKIYDKSAQLSAKGISTSESYLRYEVTLKSPSKLRGKLGTNYLWKLNNNILEQCFSDLFIAYWQPQYQKWKKESQTFLQQTLLKKYRAGSHTWSRDVILEIYNDELQTGLPRMLALDALLQELSILPFPRPQDKYNAKKSLSSVCRSITSVYQRDDDIRMQELILKLFHSQTA